MNLKSLSGGCTGDALAQCNTLLNIDPRFVDEGTMLALGCLDAPAEINTGRMVHVPAQHTAGLGLIPAGEFQVLTQRPGWKPR